MRIDDYIPGNDEDNMLGSLKDYQDRQSQYAYKATDQQLFGAISDRAARIGRIHKLAPHLEPGVVMALADANANDSMIAKVGLAAINVEKEKAEKEKAEKNQGVRNWLWGKTKTALRWGNAVGQLPFDFANTLQSSITRPTEKFGVGEKEVFDLRNPFRKGWLASTEFGTLLMEDEKVGSGIMGLGGEARTNRERRLQDFAGKIPLTKEAGASEDTQFEAAPDQIHAVALQVLAQKDISYEEAYDEANRLIRKNAFMASTYTNLAPLALRGSTMGVSNQPFQFSDVGSTEYAMTSAMIALGMAAVLPEPISKVWRGAKALKAYAQYGKYVDDLGNIVGDVATISDNLAAEARFMADTDAMVVLANDFDVASISLADEAVETLTPKPGVWWHGSSSGPIEGNRFLDIDDPRINDSEALLVGPAFYTTESPIIGGGAYPRRPGATRPLTEEEKALALEATGGRWDEGVQLGLAEETLSVDPVLGNVAPPAAAYRLIESEGANPRLIDADFGLADQVSEDELTQIVNFFIGDTSASTNILEGVLREDEGLLNIFNQMGVQQIVDSAASDFKENIKLIGFLRSGKWNNRVPRVDRQVINARYREIIDANPTLVESINFVPPTIVATRSAKLVEDFYEAFGRLPESLDEIANSSLVQGSLEDFLFIQADDSIEFLRNAEFNQILEQLVVHSEPLPAGAAQITIDNTIRENLRRIISDNYSQRTDIVSGTRSTIFTNMEQFIVARLIPEASLMAAKVFDSVMPRIDANFSRIFDSSILPEEFVTQAQLSYRPTSYISAMMFPKFPGGQKTMLEVNRFLKEIGFDGWTHSGGNIAGSGEIRHRVRALFDPMKHLDVADPITGERLPINEAVNKMRESGQLAERAGEIRSQLDEIKMMKEAGLSPDYKTVDPATANTFFTQSRAGRAAVQQIWKVVEKFDGASGMALRTNKEAWYSLWKMFKGRIPLQDMDDILRATSENELIGILNTKVGFTPGLANVNNFDFGLSKTFNSLREASRIDVLLEKADDFFGPILSRTPKSKHLHIFGSEREKLQALQDLDAFLETGVRGRVNERFFPEEALKTRENIVADFAEAMRIGDRNALFNASQQLGRAIYARIFEETGDTFQAQQASDLWTIAFDKATGKGFFNMGAEGLRTDNGYGALLNDAGEMELVGMVHGGPGLLSELLQSPLELPDIQQLRRTTSMLGIFTGKQGLQRFIKKSELRTKALQKFGVDLDAKDLEKIGELRVPLRVVEFLMHKVWKNAKKFSLAYGIRNTMEAQARLAFSDLDSIYTHPIDHLLVAAHQKLPDDILLGEEFNPLGVTNLGKLHEEAGEGYRTMLGNAYYASDQAIDMVESQFRNSRFVVYSKDVPVDWAEAGGYELRQLFNDPVARRFAAGQTLDEVMEWLYGSSDEAQKALKQIEDVMRNGETFYGAYGIAENITITPTRSNVRLRVQTQQLDRLNLKTGGDPVLMEVASKGTIRGENAFTPRGNPTPPLVEYLVENVDSTSLPTFYKARGKNTALAKAELGWFDNLTKQFFDGLVGRAHNVLDRSPLWRTEYTREVNRLAPLLSREAADQMIEIIERRVAYYNDMAKAKKLPREFTLQDYVGRNVDPDELMESLRKANGWMSRDELHVLANGLTLDRIENLLFDATKRNSITDAARIVSPFGAAFAEVLGTWMKLTAKNPDKIVNLTRKFEILANEDQPDVLRNKGLIHKDPVTGQFMYSLPMSRQVASLFNNIVGENTGGEYGLYAPVKGLNMAFNFTPGFSPIVGYPLGKLLYDSPKLRDFATFFLPYGQPKSPFDASEYAPGWLSKIISGFKDDPRSAGVYADTLADVVRVEAATGKWDLSNPQERTEFYRDAEAKARVLTIMRGVGQLIGPSSPVVDSKIKTESGNVWAGTLTSEFHKLQSEDYDSAVERFMTMFGEEAFLFMAGKTREVMSGIESSKEFAKWELENAELFDTSYADIAGFFGPKGSTFDWAAWNSQINKERRERIPAVPTQVEIAEQIVGLSKYRSIVEAAGPNPNEKTRTFLAIAKAQLEQEYPGMVSQSSFDVNKFPNQLKMMRTAVADPRLKNNETAQALRQYLDLRDVYTTFAKSRNIGWASPDSAALRADLRYRAQWIIKETPEFARIFDRILSYELEK